MKLCASPISSVAAGGSIMIEIVTSPWPDDALLSNVANSKQRDKRGWNRAVLMGAPPKGDSLSESPRLHCSPLQEHENCVVDCDHLPGQHSFGGVLRRHLCHGAECGDQGLIHLFRFRTNKSF